MPPPIRRNDDQPPCSVCGQVCRSAGECRQNGVLLGRRGRDRVIVVTPLGWQQSKYGHDPRIRKD